jgi:transcriptional regulator with XRE-family HTH domain
MSNATDPLPVQEPRSAVGYRLRAVRRSLGLSLADAARRSNGEFKPSVLGAYERGERALSVSRLLRIANAYEVPVEVLLMGEPTTLTTFTVSSDTHAVMSATHVCRSRNDRGA